MRNLILLAGIAALSLPLSSPASAQDKGQKGNGGEKSKSSQGNGGGNKNGGKSAERAPGNFKELSRSNGQSAKTDRSDANASVKNFARENRNNGRKAEKAGVVEITRGDVRRDNSPRLRSFDNGRYVWREPNYQGCPPGLAKKDNGCLPPGQARKLAGLNDQQIRWSRYSNWFTQNQSADWYYDQGYAYRINSGSNLVQSIIPLLGGALFGGNIWPQGYTDYQVSPYYGRFFGGDDYDSVRYADGAMFGVDPQTQMIGSIIGLLTGDEWNVGSPAPQGYDLYNVPVDYRDEYADSEDSTYRYNDGYVYEIDPTTQIVREIIELVV